MLASLVEPYYLYCVSTLRQARLSAYFLVGQINTLEYSLRLLFTIILLLMPIQIVQVTNSSIQQEKLYIISILLAIKVLSNLQSLPYSQTLVNYLQLLMQTKPRLTSQRVQYVQSRANLIYSTTRQLNLRRLYQSTQNTTLSTSIGTILSIRLPKACIRSIIYSYTRLALYALQYTL